MNKWFIIYCLFTMYSLAFNIASYTKKDENDRPEWAIAIIFIMLLIFKIGLVYLAVKRGF